MSRTRTGGDRSDLRYRCTAAGGIAAGQRRLALLLLLPVGLMAVAGVVTIAASRVVTGLICLAVALVAFVAWRMCGERMPLWVALEPGRLRVRTRTSEPRLAITGATARRLTETERSHLEQLASVAGVVVPSGGFDSRLLGEFELYASALGNAVLVETPEARWVITPDDPSRFLAAFEDAAAGTRPSA